MRVEDLILEEREAMKKIEEAKKKAEEIIANAKLEAKKILDETELEDRLKKYIEEQEAIIRDEANKIEEEFRQRAELLKKIPDEKIKEAVEVVLKEVLKFE
ncbi:MAG: V-type ATPase subunit subunit G family protein [Candidatus Asgardarchaeia archaeon]